MVDSLHFILQLNMVIPKFVNSLVVEGWGKSQEKRNRGKYFITVSYAGLMRIVQFSVASCNTPAPYNIPPLYINGQIKKKKNQKNRPTANTTTKRYTKRAAQ